MLKSLKQYWQSLPLILPYSFELVLPHTRMKMSNSGPCILMNSNECMKDRC